MLSDILVQYQCLYFFPALLYSSQNHSRQASSFSSFLPFLVFAFFFIYFYSLICGCAGSSLLCLVAVSRRYSLVTVRGLLIAVGSLVVEHRLQATWASVAAARGLGSCGSGTLEHRLVVVAHGPSCSVARGILPDQGQNPCLLHWQANSLALSHQGSPVHNFFLPLTSLVSQWAIFFFWKIHNPVPLDVLCISPLTNGPS